MRISIFIHILLVTLTAASALAQLNSNIEKLVDFETKSNAAALRDNKPIRLENYDIPLRLLESAISERLNKRTQSSIIFQKNGESYVRWIINPEDTKWHKEVEAFLVKNHVSTARHHYFQGYMTASRSYIVKDPINGAQFSLKVSTDVTGGSWRDKKQDWDDAYQVKLMADHVADVMRKRTPQYFEYMDEPMVFGIKEIDQGMILRQLADLQYTENRIYIPGFAALHEKEGAHIAQLNGSKDPATFWKENYIRPLGRAIAELFAMTGVAYDSPHSQNFLIELDGDFKPTGKIVFRDLGDAYVNREMVTALGNAHLADIWEKSNVLNGSMTIAQGVLHGNIKPDWIEKSDQNHYDEYGKIFFLEFEKTLSRISGVSPQTLFADGPSYRQGSYFLKSYHVNQPGWKDFLSVLEKYKSAEGDKLCRFVFLN